MVADVHVLYLASPGPLYLASPGAPFTSSSNFIY